MKPSFLLIFLCYVTLQLPAQKLLPSAESTPLSIDSLSNEGLRSSMISSKLLGKSLIKAIRADCRASKSHRLFLITATNVSRTFVA